MFGTYANPSFAIHPEVVINFLYAQDFNIDLEDFIIEVFVQIVYYWNDFFCINLGWFTDLI